MGEGVLQFTLGLATGNFLSAISGAGGMVKTFVASLFSLGGIMAGVERAFETGAGLEQLHRRTGESVQDLYELQKGFQAAGISGDHVETAVLRMQKSLGGVNDMGERTPDIFRRLGLNIEDLRKLDAPQQLAQITSALRGLDSTGAASAAASIFGRNDYATMIQLANSSKEFAAGLAGATEQGKNWQRVSNAFLQLEISFGKLKAIGSGFFAGIAEGLVGPLQMAVNLVNSFKTQLTSVGAFIGNLFKGVAEAFKEGKLIDLLEMTFAAGVEFFINMLANTIGSGSFWMGIFKVMAGNFATEWLGLVKIVASIGTVLLAAFDTAFQKLFEWIGKIPKIGEKLGLAGYKGDSFGTNFLNRKNEGAEGMGVLDDLTKGAMGMVVSGGKEVGKAVTDAFSNSGGPAQAALEGLWTSLINNSPALPASAPVNLSGQDLQQKSDYKTDFTQLEKMGFVMSGAGNPLVDYARRTALATEKLAKAVGGAGPGPSTPGMGHVNSV